MNTKITSDGHKQTQRIAFARKAWDETDLRYFPRNERGSEFIVSHSLIEPVVAY